MSDASLNLAAQPGGARAARSPLDCPVCRATETWLLDTIDGRDYWRCGACEATFVDPAHRLGRDAEHAVYLLHDNDPADAGYRRFLSKLADPLLAKLQRGSLVLDYGCGPGPALAPMLGEAGHELRVYDPFFCPDTRALTRSYDAITCTEVVEHFYHPAEEFDRLDAMLRPGGWLAVMTCFQTEDARFAGWHYRKDETHVVFYRVATFRMIAAQRGWQCEVPCKDVVLMRKPETAR
ncbi:MAG TPA: class I SAM-dependent methyltransferase [Methyloceanibacter sp.]|nr:class I SAM-dependent methyltransferase [Methyloceanibacter sp.]